MKRGAEWYKRHPQAFIDGVQGMGPELIGAYAVLLDLFYARGGDSLRDDHHLGGVLGCSTRKAKTLTDQLIARGKILQDGVYLTNSIAKTEARTVSQLSEQRASAGRIGGEKSGQSRKNKALAEAKHEAKRSTNKRREDKKDPPNPLEGETDLLGDKTAKPDPINDLVAILGTDLCQDFIAHRKSIKKPLSDVAAKRLVPQLRAMRDPRAAVNRSIVNGYQGVFEDGHKPDRRSSDSSIDALLNYGKDNRQ